VPRPTENDEKDPPPRWVVVGLQQASSRTSDSGMPVVAPGLALRWYAAVPADPRQIRPRTEGEAVNGLTQLAGVERPGRNRSLRPGRLSLDLGHQLLSSCRSDRVLTSMRRGLACSAIGIASVTTPAS
jgi:hypothetical protein